MGYDVTIEPDRQIEHGEDRIMAATHTETSEVAIFGRILEPDRASLDAAAARAIIDLDFKQDDKDRMRALLAKAKAGTLNAEEEIAIDNYERVGHMLSLMKSKARRALKASPVRSH
jgi:phage gp29-like protein